MRILIASNVFAPSVGGVEMVTALLMRGLMLMGHTVTVATNTPAATPDSGPVRVIRRPSCLALWTCHREADAVVLMGATMRLAWPLLTLRRPALLTHHIYAAKSRGIGKQLRTWLLRRTKQAACSQFLANRIGPSCATVGNPYDDTVFHQYPDIDRDGELLFVGRLILDKGADVLLRALEILGARGMTPKLEIVGDGPQRHALEASVKARGLAECVKFHGLITGPPLAMLMNRHKILVVPSTWEEPFGIVALEGIACGCAIIGSETGGLPEAVGPCGVMFPNGDPQALATRIEEVLANPGRFRPAAAAHLSRYLPGEIARRYLSVLSNYKSN